MTSTPESMPDGVGDPMPDETSGVESPDPTDTAAPDETPAEAPAPTADPVLLASRSIARDALAEITDPQTIGSDDGHEVHEDHVLTLFFECRLPGYPGWRWAATLARIDEESAVNVLETELLPGAGAVIAPEWVPWSTRLAQYREAQAQHAADEAAKAAEEEADEAEEDLDGVEDPELDDTDLDEDEADEDEAEEVDEDGFADIDEHDLHDLDDDDHEVEDPELDDDGSAEDD